MTTAGAPGASFDHFSQHGFVRVAALAPPVVVADPVANTTAILATLPGLDAESVTIALYPELCLSGYAIDDLLLQDVLLETVRSELARLIAASSAYEVVVVVGAPLAYGNRLLNCAVVIQRGRLLGVVPKSYLPTYREFYERRWFAPGDEVRGTIELAGQVAPLGPDLLFTAHDWCAAQARAAGDPPPSHPAGVPLVFHVELCEDMWVPVPPSARAALAGATLLLNLSGSPITVGRAEERRLLVRSASARCLAAYVYAAAGPGESSTDLSWDGQTLMYELGDLIAEGDRFTPGQRLIADLDLGRIAQERLRQGTFDDNRRGIGLAAGGLTPAAPTPTADSHGTPAQPTGGWADGADVGLNSFRRVAFGYRRPATAEPLRRPNDRFPFVPNDPARLALDCYEAYHIQVAGLIQRLQAIGQPKIVIGVSGGLDSTQALIVAARAMDQLGRPRSDILAFTLPGFATSAATKSQALALMAAVGATAETIDIRPAAEQLLRDLGHPFAQGQPVYDVTFENVQAGLRTDYLFRAANQRGGIVLGTGDLSELALGWCTYGVGDQMSHYAVNTGVPKTLIQHLIRWVIAERHFDTATNDVLTAILGQEISPELVPPADGQRLQSTEAIIGPYALHDFFLYHLLRHGARPSKLAYLAWQAWRDPAQGEWPTGWAEDRRVGYSLAEITHWLRVFLRRFFASQFKRSAIPNGPKVSAGGTLSPRGDWRMPSDASATAWLAELDRVLPDA